MDTIQIPRYSRKLGVMDGMYKIHLLLMKLLLIQSDLVSHSLTIALPRALDRASARGVFSPSTCSSPPLVGIADHAGIGSLQGEA